MSEAENGSDVHDQSLENVSLITLDLSLGDDDGLDIAREIRTRSNIPIIMVTGKGDTIDRVVGLELGADDYISKPFHVREVLARVRSVIRRSGSAEKSWPAAANASGDCYRFENWVADFSKLELRSSEGELCDLTSGDFRLLSVLLANPNRVLSRDRLMDFLKGNEWAPMDRSIDNAIARLRKKIERDPKKPDLIKTVRGEGYKFTGTVENAR